MDSMVDKILVLLAVLVGIAGGVERFIEIVLKPIFKGVDFLSALQARVPAPGLMAYIAWGISLGCAFAMKLTVVQFLGVTGVIPVWVDHLAAGSLIGLGSPTLNSIIGFFRNLKTGVAPGGSIP